MVTIPLGIGTTIFIYYYWIPTFRSFIFMSLKRLELFFAVLDSNEGGWLGVLGGLITIQHPKYPIYRLYLYFDTPISILYYY
jgi:hypothetical protein